MDGFQVHPDQLQQLSARFATEQGRLGRALPGFEGRVTNVEEAFGLLGPSDEAYRNYLALAHQCVTDLQQLQASFDDTALGLLATAAAYRTAEISSTIPSGQS
ncbi:MAG: type VII secretion target [Actinomycetota bacterium]|nr:type VII secretion target [Actinomycetota bacterium]MDQ3575330.1 type VII secretion target [Actinomycetota bacterium]